MLLLDCQGHRLVFVEIGLFPDPFKHLKTQVMPQGVLDHLAVSPTRARRFDSHRSEDTRV
ncbi:MAG TPA: hypothetical protein VFJ11_07660 [Gaiellaceae bacterium]|nr:hypothetical protein [Gaiellaceae bacterium]